MEKIPPVQKTGGGERGHSFENYVELYGCVCKLLGQPDEFRKLKRIFHKSVLSSSWNSNYSLVEKLRLKFALGCFYLLLEKYKKAAEVWNEVYVTSKENLGKANKSNSMFVNGFQMLTTWPSTYHWDDSSRKKLHLLTVIELMMNFSVPDEKLMENLQTIRKIANKVLLGSSKEYKKIEFAKILDTKCAVPEEEFTTVITKRNRKLKAKQATEKDTENVVKEAEVVSASFAIVSSNELSECPRFKDLAKEIHYLLGQHDENRESYRKLRKIFNATVCNVKVSKHFTVEEVDGLYFLRACYFFVSTWNKLKAIRSWIHLYNRNKKIIEFGFELLRTFPEKYNWSDYARVNLHLSTIISILEYYIGHHMLNVTDAHVCEDMISLAESSLLTFGGILDRFVSGRRNFINSPEFICHSELVNSIFDLLGDPDCFNFLAKLFPSNKENDDREFNKDEDDKEEFLYTEFSKDEDDKEEIFYLEFLRGCFYFVSNKYKAINLWIRRVNNKKILQKGFKALISAPKDYQWDTSVQENLHLSVILKYLRNFNTSTETTFHSLMTLVQLVDDTLVGSSEEYRAKGYSYYTLKTTEEISNEYNYWAFRQQFNKNCSINYSDLFVRIGKLLGGKNVARAEMEMDKLVQPALRNASSLNRVHLKFWKGCFLFRTSSRKNAIQEWTEIFQTYKKNDPIDDDLQLLTVWPNEFGWCKAAKNSLNLPSILLAVKKLRSKSNRETEDALASLEESLQEAIAKYLCLPSETETIVK